MMEPRIVVALANSVWQSAILVVFTMTLLRIMSRTSANLRYSVWLATLAVCMLLPLVDYTFVRHVSEPATDTAHSSDVPRLAADGAFATQYVLAPESTRVQRKTGRARVQSDVSVESSTQAFILTRASRNTFEKPAWLKLSSWGAILARSTAKASRTLFWLWIAVADVMLARLLVQLISLVRAKHSIEIIDTFDWISQRPGVKRRYSVGVSDTIDVPCLLGLTQPIIAIPRAIASELSSNNLRRIVVHESAHVRRYDDWFNLLEQCVLALLFFSPALYYVTRALHLEREIACDDQVVATDERLFYAECLSVLAGRTRLRSTSFVPSFFSGRRELLIRIEQLLDRKHIAHARLGLVPYAVAAVLGACALVLGQTGIPVLASPTHTSTPAAPQQQHPAIVAPSPAAKPVPKVVRARSVVETESITVRVVGKPEPTHVSPRVRVRRSAESATQPVSQTKTLVVNERYTCAGVPAVNVVPTAGVVDTSEVSDVVSDVVVVGQETATTRVAPAPPCPPAPAVAPGSGHPMVSIDRNTRIIVICTKPVPRLHQHVRMTDADIKALKAAGCTVSEPVNIQKVRLDSFREVDMNAIRANVAGAMAEMRASMRSMPHTSDFPRLDAATRALIASQTQARAAEGIQRIAEMRRQMAEMRHELVISPPMNIHVTMPKIDMSALQVFDDTGLPALPVKEITDMCHHGVTGAYIRSLSQVGYSGLPAADYIRLHDHGVTAESIKSLTSAHPGTKLSVDDLIRLQH